MLCPLWGHPGAQGQNQGWLWCQAGCHPWRQRSGQPGHGCLPRTAAPRIPMSCQASSGTDPKSILAMPSLLQLLLPPGVFPTNITKVVPSTSSPVRPQTWQFELGTGSIIPSPHPQWKLVSPSAFWISTHWSSDSHPSMSRSSITTNDSHQPGLWISAPFSGKEGERKRRSAQKEFHAPKSLLPKAARHL